MGFKQVRQKSSHLFLQRPDGRTAIVPVHPTDKIGKGVINKIIKDVKITRDDWIELIKSLVVF